MSIFLTDAPHPAEELTGHTMRVTLNTGKQVLIRRISVQAVTLDTLQHVLNTTTLVNVAAEHAQEVNDASVSMSGVPAREPTFEAMREIETVVESAKRIIKTALVKPRLEELVQAYGGREDLSDPDLGLGDDYDVILGAINAFSAPKEGDKAQAERFPGDLRPDARQLGETVQPKTV